MSCNILQVFLPHEASPETRTTMGEDIDITILSYNNNDNKIIVIATQYYLAMAFE